MLKKRLLLASILVFLLGMQTVRAEDWPMWRYDTSRSGSSPEKLADSLELQWTRQLPAPQTAWPNEPRLQFDASYLPVVAGQTMFVGSMVEGSLTAYDTATGQQRWKQYTNGPIRVAPVVWQDRVYAGSDDGFLYCFEASSGKEIWKVRGATDKRKEHLHLGNGHMVSYWPVRGGPVIDDGVLFFGAGIWPSMGVFLHAVDAESGKSLWVNRDINYLDNVRIDHNELHEAGLSPQGHFLTTAGKLLVPNGRSMPAGFDPKTGKLLHYVQGYRNGDSRVITTDKYSLVGATGVVHTSDGREAGNLWVKAGKTAPRGWDGNKMEQFEGPYFGYKFMRGCDHRSALAGGYAYGFQSGTCYAYDLSQAKTMLYEKTFRNKSVKPAKWEAPLAWKLATKVSSKDKTTRATIVAGNRIYSHVGSTLLAIEIPKKGEQPRIVWTKELDGVPAELLAADGKLFAVLEDGAIHCYGEGKTSVSTHARPNRELSDAQGQTVKQIVNHTDMKDGYALVLGIESGQLTEALLRQTNLHVIAVESDATKVRSLQTRLSAAGLYGRRAEVILGDPATLSLPPYFASLVVSERPADTGPISKMSATSLLRLLHPYHGIACFEGGEKSAELAAKLQAAKLANSKIAQADGLLTLQRHSGLPGAFDWTHECADAARTFYSRDEQVRAPLAILWYGDGPDRGFFKFKDYGRGVKPQVAGGRLVAFDDRAQELKAIDAYTGRLLWTRKLETSAVRFSTMPEAVYLVHDKQCDVLDAATGKLLNSFACRFDHDPKKVPGAVALRVTDDLLLVAIGYDLPKGHSHPAIETGLWDAKVLVALDRQSGKQLWKRHAAYRFNLHALAVGGGTVFCTDSLSPFKADAMKRRGEAPKLFPSITRAIEARSGKVLWEKTVEYDYRAMTGRGPLAIRPYDDWLCYSQEKQVLLVGKVGKMTVVEAATGKEAWSQPIGYQPLILRGDSFINQAGLEYDVASGKRLSSSQLFKRGGCNYTVGNKNLLFLRNKCATYVDLKTNKEHSLRNLRSGCSNSLVAADGLLNIPCFSVGCVCNYPLQTSFAMFHMPESSTWSGEKPIALGKK